MRPTPAEDHLPALLRIARATSTYPVDVEREFDDGEPVLVFRLRGVAYAEVPGEVRRVSGALSDYVYDRDLEMLYAVVPSEVPDAPPPVLRRPS